MPESLQPLGTTMGRPEVPGIGRLDKTWATERDYSTPRRDYPTPTYSRPEYERPKVPQLPPVRELFSSNTHPISATRPPYSPAWTADPSTDRRPSPHNSLSEDRVPNFSYPTSYTGSPVSYPREILRDPPRSAGPSHPYDTSIAQHTPRVLQPPPYSGPQSGVSLLNSSGPAEVSRVPYPVQDRLTPLALPSSSSDYRDYPQASSNSTPASTSYQTQKNGAAAQVLPKFVGEGEVPGEGVCYFYDDGSHCKKFINGEKVNEQWGVTKAGKPRKRLAVACLNCREKKIKCEPAEPKCAQCEKSGKECIMNTPRNQVAPDTPDFRAYDNKPIEVPPMARIRPTEERKIEIPFDPKRRRSSQGSEEDASSPRIGRGEDLKPERHAGKKTRRESSHSSNARASVDISNKPEPPLVPLTSLINGDDQPAAPDLGFTVDREDRSKDPFDGQQDPYVVDPDFTMETVDLYLKFVNSVIYSMFPTESFRQWVKDCREKTRDEIMVLYMIMVMGSLFQANRKKATANHILLVARGMAEEKHGKFNLQTTHVRLLLSIYYFAIGKKSKAWDWTGQCVRALFAINYHTEEGVSDIDPRTDLAYGLNKDAIMECRRRIFWGCYLQERFGESCSFRPTSINDNDIFLRLPCPDEAYDEQDHILGPYFDNGDIEKDEEDDSTVTGHMGFQVQITSLLGLVMRNAYRAKHKAVGSYKIQYEKQYKDIDKRIADWYASLPAKLKYTRENLEEHAKLGTLNRIVCVNGLARYTIQKLNRHARQCLPRSTIERNIRSLDEHAHTTLEMAKSLLEVCKGHGKTISDFGISVPIFGYSVAGAAEALGAGSQDVSKTLLLIDQCLTILGDQAQYWASSKGQTVLITKIVKGLVEQATLERDSFRVVVTTHDDESAEGDIILSTPEDIYLETLMSTAH